MLLPSPLRAPILFILAVSLFVSGSALSQSAPGGGGGGGGNGGYPDPSGSGSGSSSGDDGGGSGTGGGSGDPTGGDDEDPEYSRFEIVFDADPVDFSTFDLQAAEEMPSYEVHAYREGPVGEEFARAVRFGAAYLTALRDLDAALDPFMEIEYDDLYEFEQELVDAAVDAFVDMPDAGDPDTDRTLLTEFSEALARGDVALPWPGGEGERQCCPEKFDGYKAAREALAHQAKALRKKIKWGAACQLKRKWKNPNKRLCAEELRQQKFAIADLKASAKAGDNAARRADRVVALATLDEILTNPIASDDNAEGIALEARLARYWDREVLGKLREASAHFENIRSLDAAAVKVALYRVRIDPFSYVVAGWAFVFLDRAITAVQEQVQTTSGAWSGYATCMHRVIAPRFEASTARGRLQIYARGEWVDLQHPGGQYDLTAMKRPVARDHVWNLEPDALRTEHQHFLPVFDVTHQSQLLAVRMCHAVVIPPAQDPLFDLQEANAPYLVGDETHANRYVSVWHEGMRPTHTQVLGPFTARSLHRGCEDGGIDGTQMIDNNNDGLPDPEGATQHCATDHDRQKNPGTNDPVGQFEEDLYATVPMPAVPGKTQWADVDIDMVCSIPMILELVSRDGPSPTPRSVGQEYIINQASAWTDAHTGKILLAPEPGPNGEELPHHTQDSSQFRFLLIDNNWGAPRPHACYDWNAQDNQWERDATACDEQDL